MPRRAPARVRESLPFRERPKSVSGVSAPTLRAITDLERTRLRPGEVAEALARWAAFARGPSPEEHASCCPCLTCREDDPVDRRELLHLALHALPRKAARELRVLIHPLDEAYLARSAAPLHALRDLLTGTRR